MSDVEAFVGLVLATPDTWTVLTMYQRAHAMVRAASRCPEDIPHRFLRMMAALALGMGVFVLFMPTTSPALHQQILRTGQPWHLVYGVGFFVAFALCVLASLLGPHLTRSQEVWMRTVAVGVMLIAVLGWILLLIVVAAIYTQGWLAILPWLFILAEMLNMFETFTDATLTPEAQHLRDTLRSV
jgi:hypothetical protein